MGIDLGSARRWARALQEAAATPGARCVDATMGNGGDTEALCRLVGPEGHVWAFDVQEAALAQTRARLMRSGLHDRATLLLCGHERMAEQIPGEITLAVFNLGWLPGAPDKALTTRADTTLRALDAAMALLTVGGLITVCAYPGHDEGGRELNAVLGWASKQPPRLAQTMVQRYLNQGDGAPVLIALTRLC